MSERRLFRDKVTGKVAIYPCDMAALFPNLEPANPEDAQCETCVFKPEESVPELITEPAKWSDIMEGETEGAIDDGE